MGESVPVCQPHMWGDELSELAHILDSELISASTTVVDEFDRAFARSLGIVQAIVVVNGAETHRSLPGPWRTSAWPRLCLFFGPGLSGRLVQSAREGVHADDSMRSTA